MKLLSFYYSRKTHPVNHSLTYLIDFTTLTLKKSHDDSMICLNLTSSQGEFILEQLNLCNFESWKSSYLNRFRKDGFHWEIRLTLENDSLYFSGNATPENWNHIQKILAYCQQLANE